MKNRLAILTIEDNLNYGNRLQNYAMQALLSNRGYTTETIGVRFRFASQTKTDILKHRIKKPIIDMMAAMNMGGNMMRRRKRFLDFNRNIRFSKRQLYKNTDYSRLASEYDWFVAGSDQIWNPNLYPTCFDVNMLAFVPPEKKIAVAPSVSCDSLTPEQQGEFRRNLADFRYLSCRERRGSELIEEATGKRCETLIDPTLMVPISEWERLGKKPCFHREGQPYLLTYFLGENTGVYHRLIREFAEKKGLNVIDLYDPNSIYFTCGPSEFLYMIRNCAYMCTDSFHGSIFAYLFGRPLKILKRVSKGVAGTMHSRLEALMETLRLHDVYMDDSAEELTFEEPDYDIAALAAEQNRFNEFLDKVQIETGHGK